MTSSNLTARRGCTYFLEQWNDYGLWPRMEGWMDRDKVYSSVNSGFGRQLHVSRRRAVFDIKIWRCLPRDRSIHSAGTTEANNAR